jgi:Glu-tRNA(Gln) amidotransferase subunit E-like FAD-binding protein
MLNDEHQAVREACLTVLSQIPSLDIEKEDLNALLVCLKENNTLMRSYTYENLSHINVTSAEDFKKIIDRLLVTLSNRNEDKKKNIYSMLETGQKVP